nr:hypothetical protein [Thermosipho sp. 1244]
MEFDLERSGVYEVYINDTKVGEGSTNVKKLNYFTITTFTDDISDKVYIDNLKIVSYDNNNDNTFVKSETINKLSERNNLLVAKGAEGIYLFDVSNLQKPILVNTISYFKNISDLAIKKDILFIAHGEKGLTLMDVSDPSNPEVFRYFSFRADILEIKGDYLYILNDIDRKLLVMDIKDTNDLNIIKMYSLSKLEQFALVENFKIIDDNYMILLKQDLDNLELLFYKFSDSNDLKLINEYKFELDSIIFPDIQIFKNYLFIQSDYDKYSIIDFSDFSNIKNVGYLKGYDIEFKEEYAFVALGYGGFKIYKINDDYGNFDYFEVARVDKLEDVEKILVIDNYAFLSSRQKGLYVVDIEEPYFPKLLANYDTFSGYANDIAKINDNYMLMAADKEGILLFDSTIPTDPKLVKKFKTYFDAKEIIVKGNYVYLIGTFSFEIFKLENEEELNLKLLGRFSTFNDYYIKGLIYKKYALLLDSKSKSIVVLNISNPYNINKVTELKIDDVSNFDVIGNYMFVKQRETFNKSKLLIYDISIPYLPILVNQLDFDFYIYEMLIYKNYLYLTSFKKLIVYNFSNSQNPIKIKEYGLNEQPRNVYIFDDKMFMIFTNYLSNDDLYLEAHLKIYDISDPKNMFEIKRKFLPNLNIEYLKSKFATIRNCLYIANGDDGLIIFDISDLNKPQLIKNYIWLTIYDLY